MSELERTAAASVIVIRRDAVLMVLRARPPFAGVWSFPGGRGEPGEAPLQTARRELVEETGLTLRQAMPIGTFQPAPERPALWLTVFAAHESEVEGHGPIAGDNAAEAAFVPLVAVLERRTTAGAARWVARAVEALARRDGKGDPCL